MTMPAWLAIERSVIAFCSRSTPTSVGGIARAAGQPSAIATPGADGEGQVRPHLGRPRPADERQTDADARR